MLPLTVSQQFFVTVVGPGIVGAVVVSLIIIAYTIREFRAEEIW
jgi:hypothetical protein